ncbi:MAG: nitrite/sulfite reductase [Geminicoccaceae bacterium]|nr:nitrite/sulfite reductase [Geminicoccaceae bacterium]
MSATVLEAPVGASVTPATYCYDAFDKQFVAERTAQFRDQVERRLAGLLTEEQFKPLRLMNGVYLQLHAYMLRVAIPYGTLSAVQLRRLADIAERFDKGYGHFTTRQNLQFNWPRLVEIPDILEQLAEVEMHAIQTSGNCIRNVTTDQWAGVAADEIMDPRPWCELLRQWSSLHPEFSFLPRKFKIAVTGSPVDRAAVATHDIGLRMKRDGEGRPGFEVLAGGGLGRTPILARTVRAFLPADELLAYVGAILRVYNRFGRRDNKFKARIKILVHEQGIEAFRAAVEAEYAAGEHAAEAALTRAELARIQAHFQPIGYEDDLPERDPGFDRAVFEDEVFAGWVRGNLVRHKVPGYAIVNISLKPVGGIPGDATAAQMRTVADLAERHGLGEIRVTHEQNLVLPHVRLRDVHAVWEALGEAGLATPNLGLISDIIACPGMDYCALATARSIPVAQAVARRFADLDRQRQIGDLKIKISGCINACGHHHVGHIGILGLEKKGVESYQITLGGDAGADAAIGKILGPGFAYDEITDAVETIVDTYLQGRNGPGETFLAFHARVGAAPFKEALYAAR